MANHNIYGLMKVIQKGSFSNGNRFLVPSSLSCFKYHSKSWYSIEEVTQVFDHMIRTRPRPPVRMFTLLLDVLVTKTTHYSCTLGIFKQMCAIGIPINNSTASSVIKCYCQLQHTKHSFTILGCCFKQGIVLPHVSIYNTILDGFIGEDKTHEAERLFKKLFKKNQLLCEPDIVTYNTMIKGLCKVGNNFTAIALLRLMDGRGGCCKPDIDSYNTIIGGLCNDAGVMIDDAYKLFKEMVFFKGIHPDVITYNSLIYAFSKLGRWDEVCKILKRMKDESISLDMKTCNIIVDALCKQGKLEAVLDVLAMMRESDKYHPDIVTINSLIHGYCSRRQMSTALQIFCKLMRTTGLEPNIVTFNKLVDGYLKDMKEAEAITMCSVTPKKLLNKVTHFLFVELITRTNHHHYRSKSGYKDCKCIYLYHLYMHGDSFENALDLFHFMDGHKLNSNIEVYNILIFGANNCGKFDIARRLFHELSVKGLQPDDVTYTLIIRGFYQEGLVKDAKRMFVKMKKSGFLPEDGIVDINQLPLCYLETDDFCDMACVFLDMSGRPYRTTPPLVATLLTLNLTDQFIYV